MVYLNEFLAADEFSAAIEKSGAQLREAYGLPAVYQLGLVVSNAEAADELMVQSGLPRSFLVKVSTDRWVENGVDRQISARLGFAYHEGYELELIEPLENAGFYARDIDPDGKILVHHFGFMIRDLEAWVTRLSDREVPLLVRGKLKLGIVTGEFAYFDTRQDCGVISELISMKILGFHARLPQALITRLARLQAKIGKRCVSV